MVCRGFLFFPKIFSTISLGSTTLPLPILYCVTKSETLAVPCFTFSLARTESFTKKSGTSKYGSILSDISRGALTPLYMASICISASPLVKVLPLLAATSIINSLA